VGIDIEHPGKLITTGIFAVTRSPIHVAIVSIFFGPFLIFSNWILLVYLCTGVWLIHRQALREQGFLKNHYGKEYVEYSNRVRTNL
jgi:protein-S-isoprenylcysteine O-methyltransferase Ste14